MRTQQNPPNTEKEKYGTRGVLTIDITAPTKISKLLGKRSNLFRRARYCFARTHLAREFAENLKILNLRNSKLGSARTSQTAYREQPNIFHPEF